MTAVEELATAVTAARRDSLVVPCGARVTMQVSTELVHRCPFFDEADNGTVDITWTTNGSTLELHALDRWLGGFAGDEISHEDITEAIRDHLSDLPGISGVRVVTRWHTAGAAVVVTA